MLSPSHIPEILSQIERLEAERDRLAAVDEDTLSLEEHLGRMWHAMRTIIVSTRDCEDGLIQPKALEGFMVCLPEEPERGRALLQRMLSTCNTVPLHEESVNVLKAGLKEKMWGILCQSCGSPAAPKWVRHAKNRRFNGVMQATHTGSTGTSVSHGGWSAVRSDLVIVPRQLYNTDKRRASAKAVLLEQE